MEKHIKTLEEMRNAASCHFLEGKLCTKLEALANRLFHFSSYYEGFSFFMATHAIKIAKKANARTKKEPDGHIEYHNPFMMEVMNNMVFFCCRSEWYKVLHDRVWVEDDIREDFIEFIDCAYEWCKDELLPDGADGLEECYEHYEKLCKGSGI